MTTMNTELGEREEAPERFWIERQTQHAFTVRPDTYIETVEVGPVAEFNAHYEDLMRAALLREQNAATRMRERCVEKVREIREVWHSVATENLSADDDNAFARVRQRECGIRATSADRIITALESLTFDGEKSQ